MYSSLQIDFSVITLEFYIVQREGSSEHNGADCELTQCQEAKN